MTFRFLALLLSVALFSSCSTLGAKLKRMISGDDPVAEEVVVMPSSMGPTFSENPNLYTPVERQYRRMTQQRLEEEAEVHAKAGSLWSMEGQNSYLFSQNTSRQEGDLLNIELVGAAKNQISTKVDVIKSLLDRVEEQNESNDRNLASEGDTSESQTTAKNSDKAEAAKPSEGDPELAVSAIPTRIVERLADGNYRVKGSQPFMIGKSQYKVIVTGIVRAEDFNDEGVSTEKLLDPQYDVVSLRRVVR